MNCSIVKRRFRRAPRQRSSTRRTITLLELLLVLALLVIIGAMAFPSVKVPFQMQTLRKGGEVVRVAWCKARNRAMKTGQTQMFSFSLESGTYRTQPYYTEQDVLEVDALHSATASTVNASAAGSSVPQSDAIAAQQQELPEGVVFASVDVQSDYRSLQLQQDTLGSFGATTNMTLDQQTPPVLFYPDGTTSDAKVVLTNEYKRLCVVVSLRSLTGVVKVSELVTADEVPQVP